MSLSASLGNNPLFPTLAFFSQRKTPDKKVSFAKSFCKKLSNSFEIHNENGAGEHLLVCCHASNYFPPEFGELGLSHEERHEHIAYDIGALELSIALSTILDAPLIHSKVSRLVYDCNRAPEDFDAIPEKSAEFPIPGNIGLSEAQKQERADFAYHPYQNAIAETLSRRAHLRPKLIAIHSFTPLYMGQTRTLDVGVLIGDNSGYGEGVLEKLLSHSHLKVARDEPYNPNDRVYHTIGRHRAEHDLPSVMLEVRNDHLRNAQGVENWARIIAASL